MNLWRLTEYPSLDGEGGRLYSARWNTAGEPIVYLAASPPGALIEILVHLELEESELPPIYKLLRIAVPDRLKTLSPWQYRTTKRGKTTRHSLANSATHG